MRYARQRGGAYDSVGAGRGAAVAGHHSGAVPDEEVRGEQFTR